MRRCITVGYFHHLANMVMALGRFMRFMRSAFVPAATVIGFSSFLTFFFVLYQPTRGPGDLQRLGWQSWDIVSPPPTPDFPTGVDSADHEAENPSPPTSGDHGADVDWWNITTNTTSPIDTASLPLDVWAPLLPHDTGCMPLFVHCCPTFELSIIPTVSEITVVRCVFDLTMVDLCVPSSSSSENAIKGKWVRVPRDLNLQSGMWHLVRDLALLTTWT
jgi:hypothetical protein